MTLMVNGYEIEIKAKNTYFNNKYNKKDTERFLSSLAYSFINSSHYMETKGYEGTAEREKRCFNEIYEVLEKEGYFNN